MDHRSDYRMVSVAPTTNPLWIVIEVRFDWSILHSFLGVAYGCGTEYAIASAAQLRIIGGLRRC
jgi:hypothetical protein